MKFLRTLLLPLLSILLASGNQVLIKLDNPLLGVSSNVKHTAKTDGNAGVCSKPGVGVPKMQVPKNLTQKLTKPNTKWKPTVASDGTKVYRRNDLFDPNQVSNWTVNGKKVTGTNIERMAAGRAPLCRDGNPINLHHIGQGNESNLLELTRTQHVKYSKQLHINPNTISSDINRSQFETWKRNYWKNRAKEIK